MEIDKLVSIINGSNFSVIDVRSPSEYSDFHFPNSINIPVFNDKERAEVGTLYKKKSPQAAKERGLEIFSAKLPSFMKSVASLPGEKVLYCWRGGMRSKTAATMVDLMGLPVYRLEGGIRSYRDWVVRTLNKLEVRPITIVLNGYSGTGKTSILRSLKKEGYPVIDLENIANHRGSIFGQIGLKPNNQKTFDSLLLDQLLQYKDSPYLLIEGESKRIGKVTLPNFLSKKKENGIHVFLHLPLEERIRNVIEEYEPWNHKKECIEAFQHIKRRIHTPVAFEIEENLLAENYRDAIRLLLEYYYDPRYSHSVSLYEHPENIFFKSRTIEDAKEQIKQFLTNYHVNQ